MNSLEIISWNEKPIFPGKRPTEDFVLVSPLYLMLYATIRLWELTKHPNLRKKFLFSFGYTIVFSSDHLL